MEWRTWRNGQRGGMVGVGEGGGRFGVEELVKRRNGWSGEMDKVAEEL